MAFTLKVLFSGPCLYVQHPDDKTQVAVLMPDARGRTLGNSNHLDDEPAEPHVGFIRVNLADVRTGGFNLPHGTGEEARYELVHRFEREALIFEELAAEPVTTDMRLVPNVDEFVTEMDLEDDLFGADTHKKLVMRTILKGGSLAGSRGKREWKIPRLRSANPNEYKEYFSSFTKWERRVTGDRLTLKITALDGSGDTRIALGPFAENEVVTVQVSNLCAYNPMEWEDLPKREVIGTDEDFKWIYRLLKPRTGNYAQLLKGSALPAPRLVRDGSRTGDDDCMGARITRAWPVETTASSVSPEPITG